MHRGRPRKLRNTTRGRNIPNDSGTSAEPDCCRTEGLPRGNAAKEEHCGCTRGIDAKGTYVGTSSLLDIKLVPIDGLELVELSCPSNLD